MSKTHVEMIKCPKCKKISEMTVWDVIDVTDAPEMKQEFTERMEELHMARAQVKPRQEATVRRFQRQRLVTDTGIELSIPMEQYKDRDKVEVIVDEDGTTSVILRHIAKLTAK